MDYQLFPVYIIIGIFALIIFLSVINYIENLFTSLTLATYPNGSSQNAIYQNGIVARTLYKNSGNIFNYSMVIVVIFLFMINVIKGWFAPSKIWGIVNLFLVFFIPYIWVEFRSTIVGISTFTSSAVVAPILYNLFTSPYSIVIITFSIIMATIFNFRSRQELGGMESDIGGGYGGFASYDLHKQGTSSTFDIR